MYRKALKHTHIFEKIKINGQIFYRCSHGECWFRAPKSEMLGKKTLCVICQKNEFTLSREDLKRAKPRCLDCSNTKEAREKKQLGDKSDEAGPGDGPPKPIETNHARPDTRAGQAERRRRERESERRKPPSLTPEEADRYRKDQNLVKQFMRLLGCSKEEAIAKVEEAKQRAKQISERHTQ